MNTQLQPAAQLTELCHKCPYQRDWCCGYPPIFKPI